MLPEEWFSLFMGFQFSPSFTDTTNICHVQNLLYYGFTYVVTWHPYWVVTISFITPTRKWRSEKLLSTLFSRSVMSNSLWPHGPQHVRPPCPSSTPGVYPNSCPWSWWCRPTISSSVIPFSPCLNLSQHQGLFQWVSYSHQVAKGLEFQLQRQSFQWTPRTDLLEDGLVGSPCGPRDSQESSPTPQFKSINSSALILLYSIFPPQKTSHRVRISPPARWALKQVTSVLPTVAWIPGYNSPHPVYTDLLGEAATSGPSPAFSFSRLIPDSRRENWRAHQCLNKPQITRLAPDSQASFQSFTGKKCC